MGKGDRKKYGTAAPRKLCHGKCEVVDSADEEAAALTRLQS